MNAAKEMIQAFADLMVKTEYNWHAILLDHGTEWEGAILPDDVKRGPMKTCYETCQKRVMDDPNLTYCEGHAASDNTGIPVPHAWLVRDGQVIDPVWGAGDHEYFGVEIDTETVVTSIVKTSLWTSILEAGYIMELLSISQEMNKEAVS